MPLPPHQGVSKLINNYGRLTANPVADGADIAQAQALADSQTSVTPGEVAVQTWLPGSTMRRSADTNLHGHASRMMMNALKLRQDQDGGAQFVNYTPVIGAAARVLGPGEYLAAMTRLSYGANRANPTPPPKPWFILDHTIKLSTVAGRIIALSDTPGGAAVYLPASSSRGITTGPGFGGGAGLSGEIMKMAWGAIGTLFMGIVKPTANLIPDSADDVSGAAFSREGLIYCEEVAARLDPDTSRKSYRGAVQLNGWMSYGWTTYLPGNYGVEILGDCTEPTS